MKDAAATVMQRCEILAGISEEDGLIFRPYGCDSMREVNEIVSGWMLASGMTTRFDAIGNLTGRYEGTGEKTLVLGSHLDTVRDAGKYDGVLGVMVAIACVEKLGGERLPFAVEVVAFADEEGVRFGTTYLGSSVYAGTFDAALFERRDRDEISLPDAVRAFGGEPESLTGLTPRRDLAGYAELHIEQGPVLETEDSPLGVVTAITGQNRGSVTFAGMAGHAGTVPMKGRRDALCAAAEFVLAVEEEAAKIPNAVATVGEIAVLPGTPNVVPGEARASLDLRHQDDGSRRRMREEIEGRAREIAKSRGCDLSFQMGEDTPEHSAAAMDGRLTNLLSRAVEEVGESSLKLPSGAGHDAAQMARVCPAAMLFVRCEGGISHNPAESVTEEDVSTAIAAMSRFIRSFADDEA